MLLIRPSTMGLVACFVLVALFVQPPVVHGTFWKIFPEDPFETMRKEYDQVNHYLADNFLDENPMDVIKKIKYIVDNVMRKKPGTQRITLGKHKLLVNALAKVAALHELFVEPVRCDMHATNLLLGIDHYTRVKITDSPDDSIPRRALETFLKEVAEHHAYECRYSYPKALCNIKKKPENVEIFKDVSVAMDSVIASNTKRIFYKKDVMTDKRALLKEMAQGITNMRGMEQALRLVHYIRFKADETSELKHLYRASDPKKAGCWHVDMKKVQTLVEKYLFNPCEHFVKATKNILVPAHFDQNLGKTIKRYRAVEEKLTDLMINLEYYRLCKALIYEDRTAFMANVKEVIWDPKND